MQTAMLENAVQSPEDESSEREDMSAYYAIYELHHGRIEWLGEHVRRSNLQISPAVAHKILSLIGPGNDDCTFELRLVRRSDLPPARRDRFLQRARDFEMAVEVARRGGFERAQNKRVCHAVGKLPEYGLAGATVSKLVRPLREAALGVVHEEAMAREYREGKVDYLGRPICP